MDLPSGTAGMLTAMLFQLSEGDHEIGMPDDIKLNMTMSLLCKDGTALQLYITDDEKLRVRKYKDIGWTEKTRQQNLYRAPPGGIKDEKEDK